VEYQAFFKWRFLFCLAAASCLAQDAATLPVPFAAAALWAVSLPDLAKCSALVQERSMWGCGESMSGREDLGSQGLVVT